MSTSSVSSVTGGFFVSTSSTSSSNSSLDYSDFLTLLTAELQYQDPTNPVSSSDEISQMSQLGSLSELNNIYAASSNAAAFNLVGKEVEYEATSSSGTTGYYTGTVESVISSGGTTYVNVSGTTVPLTSIVEVAASSSTSSSSSSSSSS
ncbi:MAG: flagellar hook capping FlgD N-terminal domain-containing protein [Negativicutes bacterium]|nr:flagellar hook capping FlgD N-terminal domain-containing protein [Negativicutes bacterium]